MLGYSVQVGRGAGALAGFGDDAYRAAGAEIADDPCDNANIVLAVRPPGAALVARLPRGALLISLVQPERNPDLLASLAAQGVSVIALERVPRITRAQKMDVLSSMANLAGYRAILEAAAAFQGPFGPQVTAAGSLPPAKILVIGAGVAGLAAIAAGRALGAEVRAFDTRLAAREQVESLGGKFLEIDFKESGEGQGGYAKLMSPEFIAAEMALFRQQAAEVDVMVTTALVPGAKAPILLPRDVVAALRPGSVVVDLAAEQGGNCELTVPGAAAVVDGVTYLGYTDLTSRMATTASRFFAANVATLVAEFTKDGEFRFDLDDDVQRPALVVHQGEILPAPPPKPPSPTAVPKAAAEKPQPKAEPTQAIHGPVTAPPRNAWGSTLFGLVLIAGLFVLGRFAPQDFLQHFTVFILACFIGWQVIWSVTPALHTPLMSVTNAISGIIIVGGMLQIHGFDLASLLGVAAVLFAAINVSGGFLVTRRMLRMFHREGA